MRHRRSTTQQPENEGCQNGPRYGAGLRLRRLQLLPPLQQGLLASSLGCGDCLFGLLAPLPELFGGTDRIRHVSRLAWFQMDVQPTAPPKIGPILLRLNFTPVR